MPRERQIESFNLLAGLVTRAYDFEDKDVARDYFTRLTGLYRNFNYTPKESPEYARYKKEIEDLADSHSFKETEEAAADVGG